MGYLELMGPPIAGGHKKVTFFAALVRAIKVGQVSLRQGFSTLIASARLQALSVVQGCKVVGTFLLRPGCARVGVTLQNDIHLSQLSTFSTIMQERELAEIYSNKLDSMHSLNAAVTKKPGPKQQRLVFIFANQSISAICVGWGLSN